MFDAICRLADEQPRQNSYIAAHGETILVVQDPKDIYTVLKAPTAKLEKDLSWLRQMIGPSRFSENGTAWEIRRRLSEESFRNFSRPLLVQTTTAALENLIADIGFDRPITDLPTRLYQVVLDIVLQVQLELQPEQFRCDAIPFKVLSAIASTNTYLSNRYIKALPAAERAQDLLRYNHAREAALGQLQALRALEHRNTSLIGRLYEAERQQQIDTAEREILSVIVAGVDSTASALHWLVLTLARSPAVVTALREGGPQDLELLLDTTLAHLPSTPILARRCAVDFPLRPDEILPQGQRVIVNLLGLHGSQTDGLIAAIAADVLNPQPTAQRQLAFGGGERVCAGILFAKLLLKTAVQALIDQATPEADADSLGPLDWRLSLSLRDHAAIQFRPNLDRT